jgi:hypothetical protein
VRKIFTGVLVYARGNAKNIFAVSGCAKRFERMMKRRDQKKDRAKNAAGLMNACSKLESDLAAHARI